MFAPLFFQMNSRLKAHLCLLAVNIIYGINYSMAKMVMPDYAGPYGFVLLRVIVAGILFVMVSIFVIREKVRRSDIPRLLLLGVFGVALNQTLFLRGLDLTTPINASIIMASNPVMVLILAVFFLKDKVTILKISGMILGLSGSLMLIVSGRNFSFGSTTFEGDLCIFANSLSWALFIVMVKPLMQRYHAVTVISWVFASGFFYVLPFSYEQFTGIRWNEMGASILAAVAFVVIMSTFIAYLLNTYALRDLSAPTVSFYIYLQPALAALMAIMMGQDEITLDKCIAALLTFTGVYMVSK
ncbi:MAG: DMT family transporter [Bacteroidetes bacterium]|nr:DMT family transporter [Bacteroidota bacterium]